VLVLAGQLETLLVNGVYPDGVETEMASGYDMGTAGDFFNTLQVRKGMDNGIVWFEWWWWWSCVYASVCNMCCSNFSFPMLVQRSLVLWRYDGHI
jgi:hypothetical protein